MDARMVTTGIRLRGWIRIFGYSLRRDLCEMVYLWGLKQFPVLQRSLDLGSNKDEVQGSFDCAVHDETVKRFAQDDDFLN